MTTYRSDSGTTVAARSALVSHLRIPIAKRAFAPIAVAVLGYLITGIGNWIPSVWYDEAATITSATRSWSQLFAETHHVDLVHAAFYSFMHVVFDLVGYSPFTLRLPSALAVGAAAALIVVLARQFGQGRLGVVAAVVYILIPRVAWSGGEGRSFALSSLLAVAVTLVLVVALRSGRRLVWVAYVALCVLSVLVFAYTALVIASHIVVVLAQNRSRDRPRRLALGRWAIAIVVSALLLAPFVNALRQQTEQISWIAPLGWATWQQVFITQWFWGTAALPLLAWVLMTVGAFWMIRSPRTRSLGLIAAAGVVIPTVALLAETLVSTPLYSPRYLTISSPFVALAIAGGLVALSRVRAPAAERASVPAAERASVPAAAAAAGAGAAPVPVRKNAAGSKGALRWDRWRGWVPGVGILILAALMLPHFVAVTRAPDAKERSTWGRVASLIADQRTASGTDLTTAIIYGPVRYHATATTRVVELAYPQAFVGTVDVTLGTPGPELGQLWESHRPLADSTDRLTGADVTYLVTSIKQNRVPSTTATLAPLGWHVAHRWLLGDVQVVRYDR